MVARLLAAALLLFVLVPDAAAQRSGGRLRQPLIEDTPEAPPETRPPAGLFSTSILLEHTAPHGRIPARDWVFNASVLGLRVFLPEGFSLNLLARFEPVPAFDENRWHVPPHAAWIENLHLRWQQGPLILFAGKIHPRFGLAWSRAPGLYGAEFAGDYELREKLGFGARLLLEQMLGLPEPLGRMSLQVEAFRADTALSGGVFHRRWLQAVTLTDPATGEATTRLIRRWQASPGMGGADNADGLPGVVASLGGSRIAIGEARFGYSLGLSFRRPGEDAAAAGRSRTERALAAGGYARVPLPLGLVAEAMAEAVRQDGAGGFAGRRAEWLTAGLTLTAGPLSASHVLMLRRDRDTVHPARGFARQHAANLTLGLGSALGMTALDPFALTLDWRHLAQGGERVRSLAGGLLYTRSF